MEPKILEIVKLVDGVPHRGPPQPGPRGKVEWLVTFAGIGTVRLTTCDIMKYQRTQRQCFRQLYCMPGPLENHEQWRQMVNEALRPQRADAD